MIMGGAREGCRLTRAHATQSPTWQASGGRARLHSRRSSGLNSTGMNSFHPRFTISWFSAGNFFPISKRRSSCLRLTPPRRPSAGRRVDARDAKSWEMSDEQGWLIARALKKSAHHLGQWRAVLLPNLCRRIQAPSNARDDRGRGQSNAQQRAHLPLHDHRQHRHMSTERRVTHFSTRLIHSIASSRGGLCCPACSRKRLYVAAVQPPSESSHWLMKALSSGVSSGAYFCLQHTTPPWRRLAEA